MEALQVVMCIVRIIVDIAQVLMQRTTFNRIVVILMLIAVVISGVAAIVDFLSPSAPFVGHIVGYLALMAIPVFWLIGNLFTAIFTGLIKILQHAFFGFSAALAVFF